PVDERVRAFILETGQPCLVLAEPFETAGCRGADLSHAALRGCIVPVRQVLGGMAGPAPAALAGAQATARVREAAAAGGVAPAEFPVERYYRDAAALLAGEAGDETLRRAIARHAVELGTP